MMCLDGGGVFSAHSGNKLRQVDFDAFEGHLVL